MSPKLYPLVCGVRTWSESEDDIRHRLEAHLVRLRTARMREMLATAADEAQLELPLTDAKSPDDWLALAPMPQIVVRLSWDDRERVCRRARRLVSRTRQPPVVGRQRASSS